MSLEPNAQTIQTALRCAERSAVLRTSAQELVDQPDLFLQEIKKVLDDKKTHPILERMLRTIQGDVAKQEATGSRESPYYTEDIDDNQYQ